MTETKQPKLDDRFLTTIQGRDFVKYDGLLDLAHQHGLSKLEVEYIQLPNKENNNIAICKATAMSKDGAVYSDIGDANPSNVNRMIAPHILRMASTRAKARALRDLCNIGFCCLEELGDLDEVVPNSNPTQKNNPRNPSNDKPKDSTTNKPTEIAPSNNNNQNTNGQDNNTSPNGTDNNEKPRMSEAQKRAVHNLGQRRGLSEIELNQMAQERYGRELEQLNASDAASFIRMLQQSA